MAIALTRNWEKNVGQVDGKNFRPWLILWPKPFARSVSISLLLFMYFSSLYILPLYGPSHRNRSPPS